MKRLLGLLCALLFSVPAMAAGLPSGYTELEYIHKTGVAFIDTGINQEEGIGLKIIARFATYNSNYQYLAGAFAGSDYIGIWKTNASTLNFCYKTAVRTKTTTDTTDFHTMQMNYLNDRKFMYDDTTVGSIAETKTATSPTIYIGDTHYTPNFSSTFDIKEVEITDKTNVIAHYVPAKRDSDGAIGMYNILDNNPETAFKTKKAGEGTFTGGNPVCPNGGTAQTYTTATGTGTQNGTPTPTNPITPTFYTQGNMVLRKVGDYADSYDASTGKITRRVGVRVLNGTEDWHASSTYTGSTYTMVDGYINNKPLLCTHFVSATQPTVDFARGKCLINGGGLSLWYSDDKTTAVADIKQYLAEQYAAGTPVTVWYPLATAVEEDWAATQCESGSTCNNLFDKNAATTGAFINKSSGTIATGQPNYAYTDYIPVVAGEKYYLGARGDTVSDCDGVAQYNSNKEWQSGTTISGLGGVYTVPAGIAYIRCNLKVTKLNTLKVEQGETPTEYCTYRGKIKIATTKYNNTAFSGVVTALNNAVDTIKTVVANTITQATAVANLHSGKQTKPTDTCPNGKICLLVEDEAGTPHWYEIIERAPGIVPAGSGYTQVEYLQSSGTQYIDTGYTFTSQNHKYIVTFSNVASGNKYPSWLFGSDSGTDSRSGGLALQTGGALGIGIGAVTAGTTSYKINNSTTPITVTVESKDNNTFSISGGSTDYTDVVYNGTSISGLSEAIFGDNRPGGVDYTSAYKLYSLQMYENNTLVRDFVPARRNSDGVLGMYDTVSGNFFTNAGSGKFYAPD